MSSERIAHGPVVGLKTGRFGLGLNVKVVCYRMGRTLIDTGPPNQWRQVRRFVKDEADDPGIDRVLLTHHHEDHAGNAARIQELLDVPVYAPEASRERLRTGYPQETYRWIVWGHPRPVETDPVPETMTLADGTALQTIPAPGHSDDMVCYLAADYGLLFGADLYVTKRPEYLRSDEKAPVLIDSLHDVLEHDFHTLLCSHKGVIEAGRQVLSEKAKYLEALSGVVQRRHRYDKLGVSAIVEEILGREGLLYWLTGGDFSKHNLIASFLNDETGEPSAIVE